MRLGVGCGVMAGLVGAFFLIGLIGMGTTAIKVVMDVDTEVARDSRQAEAVITACERELPEAQKACAQQVLAIADTHILRQGMARMELRGSLEFMAEERDWVVWAFASFEVLERALRLRYREDKFTKAMHAFDPRLRRLGLPIA